MREQLRGPSRYSCSFHGWKRSWSEMRWWQREPTQRLDGVGSEWGQKQTGSNEEESVKVEYVRGRTVRGEQLIILILRMWKGSLQWHPSTITGSTVIAGNLKLEKKIWSEMRGFVLFHFCFVFAFILNSVVDFPKKFINFNALFSMSMFLGFYCLKCSFKFEVYMFKKCWWRLLLSWVNRKTRGLVGSVMLIGGCFSSLTIYSGITTFLLCSVLSWIPCFSSLCVHFFHCFRPSHTLLHTQHCFRGGQAGGLPPFSGKGIIQIEHS